MAESDVNADAQRVIVVDNTGVNVPAVASARVGRAYSGTAGGGINANVTPPAGQYVYILSVQVLAYTTAARTGAATPIAFTSNGLSVDLQFLFATAAAIGTVEEHKFESALPLKSAAAGAAVSFLAPATTSVIWAVNFSYYFGP